MGSGDGAGESLMGGRGSRLARRGAAGRGEQRIADSGVPAGHAIDDVELRLTMRDQQHRAGPPPWAGWRKSGQIGGNMTPLLALCARSAYLPDGTARRLLRGCGPSVERPRLDAR